MHKSGMSWRYMLNMRDRVLFISALAIAARAQGGGRCMCVPAMSVAVCVIQRCRSLHVASSDVHRCVHAAIPIAAFSCIYKCSDVDPSQF
jgi:hypothetical protein